MSILTLKQTVSSSPSHLKGVAGEEGAGGCADTSRVIRRGIQLRAPGERVALKKWRRDLIVQVMFLITLANEPFLSLSGVMEKPPTAFPGCLQGTRVSESSGLDSVPFPEHPPRPPLICQVIRSRFMGTEAREGLIGFEVGVASY